MSAVKKNPVAFLVFVLFIIIFPVLTVYLSRAGLQRNKMYKSDMTLLQDSVYLNFANLADKVSNKIVIIANIDEACSVSTLEKLKELNNKIVDKDRNKIRYIIQTKPVTQDSSWSIEKQYTQWDLDSAQWIINPDVNLEAYNLPSKSDCAKISLVNSIGQLCDHYTLGEKEDENRLLKHMVLTLPKKDRKKIEYKADKKLY